MIAGIPLLLFMELRTFAMFLPQRIEHTPAASGAALAPACDLGTPPPFVPPGATQPALQ
jgi:hypothetical protein